MPEKKRFRRYAGWKLRTFRHIGRAEIGEMIMSNQNNSQNKNNQNSQNKNNQNSQNKNQQNSQNKNENNCK